MFNKSHTKAEGMTHNATCHYLIVFAMAAVTQFVGYDQECHMPLSHSINVFARAAVTQIVAITHPIQYLSSFRKDSKRLIR